MNMLLLSYLEYTALYSIVLLLPVTGGWEGWLGWQRCTHFCNQSRSRFCSQAVNKIPNGEGSSQDNRRCNGGDCCAYGLSKWGEWAPWTICGECSKFRAVRSRTRPCLKNLCRQPCLLGEGKETDFCPVTDKCNVTGSDSNKTDVQNFDTEFQLSELSTTAKVMIAVLLILFVGIVVGVCILIIRRRHRDKVVKSREPEVIDINVGLPGLLQQTVTEELSSVSSSDISETSSVGDRSVPARRGVSTGGGTEVDLSTRVPSDLESNISEGNPQGQDIHYHAPGFYYD